MSFLVTPYVAADCIKAARVGPPSGYTVWLVICWASRQGPCSPRSQDIEAEMLLELTPGTTGCAVSSALHRQAVSAHYLLAQPASACASWGYLQAPAHRQQMLSWMLSLSTCRESCRLRAPPPGCRCDVLAAASAAGEGCLGMKGTGSIKLTVSCPSCRR